MALIDMAQPYIYVESMQFIEETSQVEISFKVNGCIRVDEISVYVDDMQTQLATAKDGHVCNYLLNHGQIQTTYTTLVNPEEDIVIEAIVDQHMKESVHKNDVQPSEFINNPQSHFAKIRVEDNYSINHNGKFINASKRMQLDLTEKVDNIFRENTILTR